jgi:membrane-associated phospholipid phosphatase
MLILAIFFFIGLLGAVSAWAVFGAVHGETTRVSHGPVHATARVVQRELSAHRRVAAFLRQRMNPAEVTGLLLTIALGLLVIVGVLAFQIREQSWVTDLDADVASWAAEHATAASTDVLRTFTDVGGTMGVSVVAIVVVVVEIPRGRGRMAGLVLFLLVTIGGNSLLTTSIKEVVERERPDVERLAGFSGFSFPSGHSSAAAAGFAACALCLGLGRSLTVRRWLAAIATALAFMVAASRVLLGVHWTSDVIAGLSFGGAWFALCAIAFGGRLLRFGAPVEIATRVDASRQDTGVEVDHRTVGERRPDHDADQREDDTDDDVGQVMHAEQHP